MVLEEIRKKVEAEYYEEKKFWKKQKAVSCVFYEPVHDRKCNSGFSEGGERGGTGFSRVRGVETSSDADEIKETSSNAVVPYASSTILDDVGFELTGRPEETELRALNLDASVLRPESTWSEGDNLVYFGTYDKEPVLYRVLAAPNTQDSSENYLLLDCDSILAEKEFDEGNKNIWNKSGLGRWMWEEFYQNNQGRYKLSEDERYVIGSLSHQEKGSQEAPYGGKYYDDTDAYSFFCLSAAEAEGLYEGSDARKKQKGKEEVSYWLRSATTTSGKVGCVDLDGVLGAAGVTDAHGVSPALDVSLGAILFASEIGMEKNSALGSVSENSGNRWKLTLIDESKNLGYAVCKEVVSGTDGTDTITVAYTCPENTDVTQISVMITDRKYTERGAKALYYGALQDVTTDGKTGSGTFSLPEDLEDQNCGKDYHIYIFAEEVNGETESDSAGVPFEITVMSAVADGRGLGVFQIVDPVVPLYTFSEWSGSYVYFGSYEGSPVKYRVLASNTTDFGGRTMLLDCDRVLWKGTNGDGQSSRFDESSSNWAESELRAYLNGKFLEKNYTAYEQAAIASSSKAEKGSTDGSEYVSYTALNGEKIFLLDAVEVTNETYGYYEYNVLKFNVKSRKKTGDIAWWLRSAVGSNGAGWVSNTENFYGYIGSVSVDLDSTGVSPALNVDLSSVLFSKLLEESEDLSYKLTLIDEDLVLKPKTVVQNAEGEVTVSYSVSGERLTPDTQIGLMVLDREYTAGNTNGAKLIAYETLTEDCYFGKVTFSPLEDGEDFYYYLVAEKVNDGYATDYASVPVQITIPVPPTITAQPESQTVVEGDRATFTVSADGKGLTYQWMVDKQDGNGWVRIEGANAAVYTISKVEKSSNGFQYFCVISNHGGSVESNAAALIVQEKENGPNNGNTGNPGGDGPDNGNTGNPGGNGSDNGNSGSSDRSDEDGSDDFGSSDNSNSSGNTGNSSNSENIVHYDKKKGYVSDSQGIITGGGDEKNPQSRWVRDEKGWWFSYADGTWPKGTKTESGATDYVWERINGTWWAFDSAGYIAAGWIRDASDGCWYYLDGNTGMAAGWYLDPQDGHWYYLDPATGALAAGWRFINGKWYYLNPIPAGNGNTRPYGSMYKNERTPDGYPVGTDGSWIQ